MKGKGKAAKGGSSKEIQVKEESDEELRYV
jgi:hypothetical protein